MKMNLCTIVCYIVYIIIYCIAAYGEMEYAYGRYIHIGNQDYWDEHFFSIYLFLFTHLNAILYYIVWEL